MNKSRRFWLALAISLVGVGMLGSFFGARLVARNDAQRSHQQLVNSASEIASTLQLSLQHEQDLATAAAAFSIGNPQASQAQFALWMDSMHAFDRYPELQALAELAMVPASQLPSFAGRALVAGTGSIAVGGVVQIAPAGARPFYCLRTVAQVRAPDSVAPANLDYCDTALGPGLLATRDSGLSAYLPYRSGRAENLAVGTPVYRGGVVPPTVGARRAAFLGWTGAQIVPGVLLAASLAGHPGTLVAFRHGSGALAQTFTAGRAPVGARSVSIDLRNGWQVKTDAMVAGSGVLANWNSLALLVTGTLVSLLVGLLIYVLGTSRTRALVLVDRRTEELRHQAFHDPLTGLPNRALILDRTDQMLVRCRRENVPLAALFLDLDDFKDINDTLGHGAGDQLLVGVGARLAGAVRESDTVGRVGGDEFVILVEGDSMADGAESIAQRIGEALEAPFDIAASHVPLFVTASIGIASGTRLNAEGLLRDADIALYRAKEAGKHCAVNFLPPMQQSVEIQHHLEVDLRIALEEGQFFLVYQPTVHLGSGELNGVEALLRWRHPDRGIIQPSEFIPPLEASGLIVQVGRWVLNEACRQGLEWRDHGHQLPISVNVSGRQLDRDRIVDDVYAALSGTGFDPGLLTLELTETALMRDVQATATRLQLLKTIGVRLAIDDFGTGYSSLAYLQQFPVDVLKIDQSFVSRIADSPASAGLIHTLVQLGKVLGLETLAEGIETDDQWSRLRDESVDTGQGFLFARPLEVSAIDQLLTGCRSAPLLIPAH